jgi:sec-independent protein translocase protein TatA
MDPLELGTVAAIVLVLFLWGPQKIPELARAVARARRELDSATREFQKVSQSIQDGTSPLLAPTTPGPGKALPAAAPQAPPPKPIVTSAQPRPSVKTGDQLLIEAARKLGIPTGGKTREQIQQEIIAMAQRPTSSEAKSASNAADSAV